MTSHLSFKEAHCETTGAKIASLYYILYELWVRKIFFDTFFVMNFSLDGLLRILQNVTKGVTEKCYIFTKNYIEF